MVYLGAVFTYRLSTRYCSSLIYSSSPILAPVRNLLSVSAPVEPNSRRSECDDISRDCSERVKRFARHTTGRLKLDVSEPLLDQWRLHPPRQGGLCRVGGSAEDVTGSSESRVLNTRFKDKTSYTADDDN